MENFGFRIDSDDHQALKAYDGADLDDIDESKQDEISYESSLCDTDSVIRPNKLFTIGRQF